MIETLTPPTPMQVAKECHSLNELEQLLATCPPCEHVETHRFTPHLYSRQIFLKKGTLCTSKIHKTEHQFIVSQGVLKVWSREKGWELIVSPYHGITKPGARRALYILEDTVWTTFHVTDKTDVEEILQDLIEPHDIPTQREAIS